MNDENKKILTQEELEKRCPTWRELTDPMIGIMYDHICFLHERCLKSENSAEIAQLTQAMLDTMTLYIPDFRWRTERYKVVDD